MGYQTEFSGAFVLDRPLTVAHKLYLECFSGSRRMKRNPAITAGLPDIVRESAGITTVGVDGGYYVGHAHDNRCGQSETPDVISSGHPPEGQPGLWCEWVPSDDGKEIEWSGGEKFYDYIEWIIYLVEHFLKPWGYVLNGRVEWNGEERGDVGVIVITDNTVEAKTGRVVYD